MNKLKLKNRSYNQFKNIIIHSKINNNTSMQCTTMNTKTAAYTQAKTRKRNSNNQANKQIDKQAPK